MGNFADIKPRFLYVSFPWNHDMHGTRWFFQWFAQLISIGLVCTVALRASACENDVLAVICHEQDAIQIINAHYGRPEADTCDADTGTLDTECLVTGARDIVVNRSDIDVDNSVNYKPSRDGRRYVARDLELWPVKNSFCAFLARIKTYTHTRN